MLKSLMKQFAANCRFETRRVPVPKYGNPKFLEKATTNIERFREVVSDPLNLLIARVPEAGFVDGDGCVILHNGNRVPLKGPFAYYGDFSDLLVINRGVHEPLEEFCFQTLLSKLRASAPIMLELGAYWAHYSMWLQKRFPEAVSYMIEPDPANLQCGKNNFDVNGCHGEFIHAFVGATGFQVDRFLSDRGIARIAILHSDIQGSEMEMLQGAQEALSGKRADYVFISTHSEHLHASVVAQLQQHAYRVEVSSGFDTHTTSYDGFVLASSPTAVPLFERFAPLGRLEIARSSPQQLLQSLTIGRS